MAATDTLKDDLVAYAKDKAEVARDQAGSLIEERKTAAAEELADLSEALRQASDHLRTRSRSMIAGVAQTTADQLEGLAASVRDRDVVELLDDAQRFARRQPEMFFAGAVLLGFLAVRTLRSARSATAEPASTPESMS